ncbi:MAG: polyprenyl synthetase family protein [Streptosporangiales bacterium]|nr:polyprenyl synthetase family protein [Streptosporangiales bacterium]
MTSAAPTGALLGLPTVDEQLAADLRAGLAEVETGLRAAVESGDPFVTDTSRHLMEAGGKRFRAMLVLLAARFGDPGAREIVPAAVVIELTHLATLYHDDVMDEAALRRGEPSANARWGNTVAILTGDYVFARASELLAGLGPEAVRIQAATYARLVYGQIKETVGPREGDDALAHYLQVVSDKTASLIATSGRFGAMFAGADARTVETITRACEALGTAFQLSDDILDVVSESAESGKTPGTDLREGVLSLPVLHALRSRDPEGERLRTLLSGPLTDDERLLEALSLLRAHPAMDQARTDLRRWADDARAEIVTLPDIPARAAFEALCDFVIDRSG